MGRQVSAYVTVHQCPGCRDWQVDYDAEIVDQWPIWVVVGSGATLDLTAFNAALDDILREHAAECPALATIIAETGRA